MVSLLLEQMKIWSLSFLPISRSKSITRARIFLLNIYSYKSFSIVARSLWDPVCLTKNIAACTHAMQG